jgi:hypothetical protein
MSAGFHILNTSLSVIGTELSCTVLRIDNGTVRKEKCDCSGRGVVYVRRKHRRPLKESNENLF